MLARKNWNLLIVDDEPDVHQVTELVLKKEEFFGVKLKFHHANSTAEAKALFAANPGLELSCAVALIDVVMETDHAGLDLCRWIREARNRQSTALILRTGQPGIAPPRKIIDDYNITGYLTKMEATADRLYMLVKQGIQRFYETSLVQNRNAVMDAIRREAKTPAELLAHFEQSLAGWNKGPDPMLHVAHDFFGQHYVGVGAFKDKAAYVAIKDELLAKAAPQLQAGDGIARVDSYDIIQTRVLGTDKVVTLVLKDAVIPRGQIGYYGAIIRQSLAYLGEVLARG